MKIALVSEDRDLYGLCREVLAEVHLHRWTLSAVASQSFTTGSDFYIWDFQPNTSLPKDFDWSSSSLFLVASEDLGRFRKTAGAAATNILLKPVARTILAAFLEVAFSTRTAEAPEANQEQILECLIQTNLKLQEYDLDRTNFLARVAHDFRSPITAVGGYCGLLLGEGLGPLNETQKTILQRMQKSVDRLSRMASTLFEVSVERQVKKRADLQAGDIQECIDQALHEIAPMALDKRIAITVNLDPCHGQLYFDGGQTEEVLVNFLENACRFTPKTGSIEIRGYPFFWERRNPDDSMRPCAERRRNGGGEANSYRIDICNSGAAIPHEQLDRIFEEYTALTYSPNGSGCGLGLAICRMIITQHEGRVWAENTEVGPKFSFILPIHNFEPSFSGSKTVSNVVATVNSDAAI
jgi:signal transduction histidine kinase